MALIKRRKYTDFLVTNPPTFTAPSTAPYTLDVHPAQGGATPQLATFLRGHVGFAMSVSVDPVGAPPEGWWHQARVLLFGWWSDSGATVVGNSFGVSEHFLGSRVLQPVLVASPAVPSAYYVTWSYAEDLVFQTSRKGAGPATPHFMVGMTLYDPVSVLSSGAYSTDLEIQGHTWSLWGDTT